MVDLAATALGAVVRAFSEMELPHSWAAILATDQLLRDGSGDHGCGPR
jgi:hypothetical protein